MVVSDLAVVDNTLDIGSAHKGSPEVKDAANGADHFFRSTGHVFRQELTVCPRIRHQLFFVEALCYIQCLLSCIAIIPVAFPLKRSQIIK